MMNNDMKISPEVLPNTQVMYNTDNNVLKTLFDKCELMLQQNIKQFKDKKVLVEGSVMYPFVWLETQPMGGEMYAKRNMEVALNNQLIFIENQREDGRIPGMIGVVNSDLRNAFPWFKENGLLSSLEADGEIQRFFGWVQGYCFPVPAFKMYYHIEEDKAYLQKLYNTLEGFDNYLWKYRDSNGDGCLETWCVYDTGEDESTRFEGAPLGWEGETPPRGIGKVPYASMDFMGYSCNGRDVLAKISKELDNGKEEYWSKKADEVRRKIKDYLWRPEKHACYDRDCNNEFMETLLHNSLRVMYYGGFTQDMADEFIAYHMLNPEEFWTNMPLPSIAVNDPLFRNHANNNWSGQPESLTYQRAIQALENYGHYAELTLLGRKYLEVLGKYLKFPQQFDPFTAKPSMDNDGYGPTLISVLEYFSRLYGVYISMDEVFWSGLEDANNNREYTQIWGDDSFKLESKQGFFSGYINGTEMFVVSNNVRIITDLSGNIKQIVGIDTKTREIELKVGKNSFRLSINPNEVYIIENEKPVLLSKVTFDYPYSRKLGN